MKRQNHLALAAMLTTVSILLSVGSTPREAAAAGEFVERFDANDGRDRFDMGVWHRGDDQMVNSTWSGDHDESCGSPDTQRTIRRSEWQESFYTCRDHFMTSVGHTAAYSVAWFSPRQTFSRQTARRVSWDVNVTHLGSRQWWDVLIYPAEDQDRYTVAQVASHGTDCIGCAVPRSISGVSNLPVYGSDAIAVGNGPIGGSAQITAAGVEKTLGRTCGYEDALFVKGFPEGESPCDHKPPRMTFEVTDNGDGTITVDYGGVMTRTVAGSFPDQFRVSFKDHNYTPDKDGTPAGHTWHWDNIAITSDGTVEPAPTTSTTPTTLPPTTSTTPTTLPPTTSTTPTTLPTTTSTTPTTLPPTTSTTPTTLPPTTTSTTPTTLPPTTTSTTPTTLPVVGPPERVAQPMAEAGDGQVSLKWAPPYDGGSPIDDYDVRMRAEGDQWRRERVLFTDPEFVWTNLRNGEEYEFQVRAENAHGNGQYSESVFATPGVPPATTTPTTTASTTTTTTTTTAPTTTTTTTTTPPTTTAPTTTTTTTAPTTSPPAPGRFETLPVGAALPSGAECADRVRPAAENRPENAPYNSTPGTDPHDGNPRVDGDFTGTTDEILQWVACKWGIDEDVVRAQTVVESWWRQEARGDYSYDTQVCHPDVRDESPCAESLGLMQVRYQYHSEAFEDSNAVNSSAYNVDYAYSVWRACYEGELWWLNTVERGRQYAAGDANGCLGVWYSGRWYTDAAVAYVGWVMGRLDERTWEQPYF